MTNREFKSIPYFRTKSADSGRSRTGICAVFGNVDDWGDMMMPGSFTKTIQEGRDRVKHLWNHDFGGLPTASIKELREVSRDALPPEVLDFAPDATGGLMVTREYYEDEFSDMILKRLDAGDITEMSFGFDVKRYEIEDQGDNMPKVRKIMECALYDTSDVLWGMNDSTVAAFAKSIKTSRPLGAIAAELQLAMHNIKAGSRNSAQDMAIIDQIHKNLLDLGYAKCIISDETGGKSANQPNPAEDAAAALNSTALLNQAKVNDLRLSELREKK